MPVYAVAPTVSLPSDLPDVGGTVSLAITSLGGVVAAVLAGYLGFQLIRVGIRYALSMLDGEPSFEAGWSFSVVTPSQLDRMDASGADIVEEYENEDGTIGVWHRGA